MEMVLSSSRSWVAGRLHMTSGLQIKKRHLLGGYRVVFWREVGQWVLWALWNRRVVRQQSRRLSSFHSSGKAHFLLFASSIYLLYSYSYCCMSAVSSGQNCAFTMALVGTYNSCCSRATNQLIRDSEAQFMSSGESIWWRGWSPLSRTSDLAVAGVESSGQSFSHFGLTDSYLCFLPWTPLILVMPLGAHLIHAPWFVSVRELTSLEVNIPSNDEEWELLHKCS